MSVLADLAKLAAGELRDYPRERAQRRIAARIDADMASIRALQRKILADINRLQPSTASKE